MSLTASALRTSVKKLRFTTEQKINLQQAKEKSPYLKYLQMLLPPFIIILFQSLYKLIQRGYTELRLSFRSSKQKPYEDETEEFVRRKYEQYFENINLEQKQLGFTNQVLYQQNKKTITLYLPVYITCKIKSIQDIDIQTLTGNISCAIIINISYGDIPDQVVKILEKSIIVQMNRGDALKLCQDEKDLTITFKKDQKNKFLTFTVRRIFLGALTSDTLWTPFEVLDLVISFTLNTVTINPDQFTIDQNVSQQDKQKLKKQYKISFNCMRNNDRIPISYALDCVFGIYDLAENKLEAYYSKFSSYAEISKNFQDYSRRLNNMKKLQKDSKKQSKQGQKHKKKHDPLKQTNTQFLSAILQNTMKRLSVRPSIKSEKKTPKKVKYFQYAHFVISLYKYPGNSLSTIFIPIFLLALISLSIFFQQPELSSRIGSIATMILGYISLIPSIKDQLPPSSQLTVIEAVVYIQTLCCLLCLFQSWIAWTHEEIAFKFIWHENISFMLCLVIHIGTFLFIISLYILHKLKWQPSYNCDQKVQEIRPIQNLNGWDNPFCDEVFLKFNREIATGKYTPKEREQSIIKPYPKRQIVMKKQPGMKTSKMIQSEQYKKQLEEKSNGDLQEHKMEKKESSIFSLLIPYCAEKKVRFNNESEEGWGINTKNTQNHKIQDQDQDDEFYVPNQQLYYRNKGQHK